MKVDHEEAHSSILSCHSFFFHRGARKLRDQSAYPVSACLCYGCLRHGSGLRHAEIHKSKCAPYRNQILEFGYIMVNPEEYNEAWQLRVRDVGDPTVNTWEIDIPAYTNNLQTPVMALTGRLSGTWVVPGVPDQGLVLAFEEEGSSLMPRGLFFLSWYTFDDKGELLWLTGK